MAVTLAVGLLRSPAAPAGAGLDRPARFAVALFAISLAVSTLVGLAPLPRLDANALYGYLTGFNALRELKGPLWALLLLPLLVRQHEHRQARLAAGIAAGLCAVVGVVLWERLEFTGLFNMTSGYRAEGPFPEVHVGGGDIHAYLVTAMPFVVAWMSIRSTTLRVACGTLLFAVASYALAVTFARGGYVGYVGMIVVLAVGTMLAGRMRAHASHWSAMIAVPVALGIVVTLWFASSGFMQRRVSASESEAVTRIEHWQRALDMIDPGPEAALFGMGLGSFPRTVLYKDPASASATVSYQRSGGDTYVRLGSGRPLYLGQRVAVEPGHRYGLAFDLRSRNADAAIEVSVCAKSIQQSFDCRRFDFRVDEPGSAWEHRTAEFDSGDLSQGPGPLHRPVTVSLANSRGGSVVDVTRVRLVDVATGRDLVANGDFARAGAHWLFAADDHLPWHIFNLGVQVRFEQGWLGVVSLLALIALAIFRTGKRVWQGSRFSIALLASLCGFLLVGITESLFDGPRITTLFFVLLITALLPPTDTARDESAPDSR